MRYANKVLSVDEAIAHVRNGSRLMLGEFVGAGEPACCIEALLASGIGQLTLITNTPGLRGGFLKARLFSSGQLAEFIGTHVGTTDESTQAYLTDSVRVAEFFPMGTWAEKVRAGALGLGGALVPVGVGILANWACDRNGKWWPGIGGAMDLCYGTRKVIAALAHTDKHGNSKILPRCTLPLTGRGCVKVIVTEHAVLDVTDAGLVLREILSHATLDDIRAMTAAPFTLAPLLQMRAA